MYIHIYPYKVRVSFVVVYFLLLVAIALWPKTVATHQFPFRLQLWLSPIIHA